jgi:colanic acid biosynthesis glycosyl transferase WcaI
MESVDGTLRVGYLGNFGVGQGLDVVIDAARRLAGQGVQFVLAGDGPEWRRIRSLAEKVPGVAVHPPIAKESTRAFYGACDLCLVPLAPVPVFQETVPSKLFEVMACERPVVAVLGGEGAKIVNASGGGWVTPPGDGAALARTLCAARDTPAVQREHMGRQGRAYVGAHYSREVLAERYLGILRQVAALRGRRGAP